MRGLLCGYKSGDSRVLRILHSSCHNERTAFNLGCGLRGITSVSFFKQNPARGDRATSMAQVLLCCRGAYAQMGRARGAEAFL